MPVLDAYAPSPITLNAVFPQHREGFVTLRTFIGFLAERLGDAAPAAKAGRAPGAVAGRFAGIGYSPHDLQNIESCGESVR